MDSTANRRCTIQRGDGSFCDSPTHPDAPFPICSHHARKAYEFGISLMAGSRSETKPSVTTLALEASWPRIRLTPRAQALLPKPPTDGPGVYFLALDGLIKIGASATVRARAMHYPPSSKILALVRSNDAFALEKKLHSKFSHLREAGREWFTPGDDLLTFIREFRS